MSPQRTAEPPLSAEQTRLRGQRSVPTGSERRSRGTADRVHSQLEHLYEIGKLLTSFEGLEQTFSAVLTIATGTLAIRSAVLIEATDERPRMLTWHADNHTERGIAAAKAHARNAYAYLMGRGAGETLDVNEETIGPDALARQEPSVPAPPNAKTFVVIPLVVGRHRSFGVLQLEGATSLHKLDLVFINAIANQLAVALDRHHAWQRDIALRESAEEATRMRDQILGIVSHDLKNPLLAILLTAGSLANTGVWQGKPKLFQVEIERIQQSAARMQRLIDDLLDFASIQDGRLALMRGPVDPASIVGEAVASFATLIQVKGVHMESAAEPGLKPIYCDRGRLLQIFSNLIDNALSVSVKGDSIVVRAAADHGAVSFSVSDTGPGIAPDELEHVFERYWRSHASDYKGRGLGLFIAKLIAETHGGRIWAESTLGHGATFSFTIPVAQRFPGRIRSNR